QDFDSPERRAALDKTLREQIARIPDETTRRHYAEALRERRYQLFGGRRGAGRLTPAPGARPGGGARKGARGAPPFQSQGVLPQTKISAIAAGAGDDSLLETLILAICARHPGLAARFEAGLERLEPQDPGRAALCHDLLAGSRSARGDEALSRIMDDPYVRLSPLIAQGADAALAGEAMGNLLAQLAARRAARREMARAEAEITGVADEGLTWRARETALARAQAERPGIKGAGAVDEDRAALSARLRAALGGPRLDAPAPGGAEAGTDDEPD
ncbi:MAG: DNA primase, partial [Paracoccus sp. (in: a-proteobacteria)]|nr:DNA primase [Paracoccus sp. (in: a-proteobacteria)]